MRPSVAIAQLQALKTQVADAEAMYGRPDESAAWKSKVRAVVANALGTRHHLVAQLDSNSYSYRGIAYSGMDRSVYPRAFGAGVQRACGYIDAAIYELELLEGNNDPVDERAYDGELWDHINGLVEAEEWDKVPSAVVTFVEDRVRTWGALDAEKYGKGLYAAAFGDAGELRMGKTKGEWEGWRGLGMGFAQAVGNVDRHRLQRRDDARRYAIGVMGLGSLLLVQLRYEHEELIDERDVPPPPVR